MKLHPSTDQQYVSLSSKNHGLTLWDCQEILLNMGKSEQGAFFFTRGNKKKNYGKHILDAVYTNPSDSFEHVYV